MSTFVFVTCADLIFTFLFISSHSANKLSSDDAVKRVLAGEKVDTKGRIDHREQTENPETGPHKRAQLVDDKEQGDGGGSLSTNGAGLFHSQASRPTQRFT